MPILENQKNNIKKQVSSVKSKADQKLDIFNKIAALRVSCEAFPSFDLNYSLPSSCNSTNPLEFLLDLIKSTIGFQELFNFTAGVLTYEIPNIEADIKNILKDELKKMISCGVYPSIPDFVKHQNVVPTATGVNLSVSDVDYADMMLINPVSDSGKLVYDDPISGLNSTDFNTYLFNTIQEDSVQTNWGSQTQNNNILSLQFDSVGVKNNQLNIRVSEYYSQNSNGKSLVDVVNDYVDSINIFGTSKVLNNTIDMIFGTISSSVNKTASQLLKEAEVNDIIECIINADGEIVADDSFFTFDNEAIRRQNENVENRKNGVRKLKSCNDVDSSVSLDSLKRYSESIDESNSNEVIDSVTIALNNLSSESAQNTSSENQPTANLDFINQIIKNLMVVLTNIILSPKVLVIFLFIFNIIFGTNIDNIIEFIKINLKLIQNIINKIRDYIIDRLLDLLLKEIVEIVKCQAISIATEFAKNNATQLASLVGIQPWVLGAIKGAGTALSTAQSVLDTGLLNEAINGKITGFGCKKGECNG